MEKSERYAVKVSSIEDGNKEDVQYLYEIDRGCIYSSRDIKDAMFFNDLDDAKAAWLLSTNRTSKVCSIVIDRHEIVDYKE